LSAAAHIDDGILGSSNVYLAARIVSSSTIDVQRNSANADGAGLGIGAIGDVDRAEGGRDADKPGIAAPKGFPASQGQHAIGPE